VFESVIFLPSHPERRETDIKRWTIQLYGTPRGHTSHRVRNPQHDGARTGRRLSCCKFFFFYLWVLHPVAYLSNWFFMTPSIAPKFQYINSLLFSFLLTTCFGHYGPSSGGDRAVGSGGFCLTFVIIACISNISITSTTKKGIIPHKNIKERKAHNNCLRKISNNNRRKTKASAAHSSITTTLMD
jgi:hypothetical protein